MKILFEVKLTDLYDEYELNDETEALYNFIDEEDLERDFTIHVMTPEQAMTYTTYTDDTTVYQSFEDFATEEAEEIVDDKIKNWDNSRIILTINNTLLDGYHHLIAGIKANKNIKYINLAD